MIVTSLHIGVIVRCQTLQEYPITFQKLIKDQIFNCGSCTKLRLVIENHSIKTMLDDLQARRWPKCQIYLPQALLIIYRIEWNVWLDLIRNK